jgi:MFS family permease
MPSLRLPIFLLRLFWPFLIVRVFQGIGFAFFHTASFTLIANITSETNRGQSLSYFTLASTVSSALGPPLGIFLINHFGFTLLFPPCVGLSLCSLFITSKLGVRPVVPLRNPSTKDGFFSRRALSPAVLGFYSLFTWGAIATFFPLYALAHGMSNPGLFFTTVAIMLILCRILGGKVLDRYGRERNLPPCLTICIISMVALAFSKTIPMFIIVAVVWGIGYAFLMPLLLAYTVDRAGSSLGPAMGTFTAVSDLGLSLGPTIMGIVIHSTSYSIMFLCLAIMGVLTLNYFLFFVRKDG